MLFGNIWARGKPQQGLKGHGPIRSHAKVSPANALNMASPMHHGMGNHFVLTNDDVQSR